MSDSLTDIWKDPAEAVAELLIEKGTERISPVLAHMPLLSFAIAAYKSKGAISDYLLARKVQQFYTAWELLSEADRRKVYEAFQKKPRAFVEKILFILAQQEDLQKCRIIGVLTTMYLQGELKRREYLDFIETMTHVPLGDLERLVRLSTKGLIFTEQEVVSVMQRCL